jgi:hypothetical protein
MTALRNLENAQYVIYDFDYQLHGSSGAPGWFGPEVADLQEWGVRSHKHDEAIQTFKLAIRAELGLDVLNAADPSLILDDPEVSAKE